MSLKTKAGFKYGLYPPAATKSKNRAIQTILNENERKSF